MLHPGVVLSCDSLHLASWVGAGHALGGGFPSPPFFPPSRLLCGFSLGISLLELSARSLTCGLVCVGSCAGLSGRPPPLVLT